MTFTPKVAVPTSRDARDDDSSDALPPPLGPCRSCVTVLDGQRVSAHSRVHAARHNHPPSTAAPIESDPRCPRSPAIDALGQPSAASRHLRRRHSGERFLLSAAAAALVVVGSACSASAPSASLANLETMAKQCNGEGRIALVASDESETSREATSQPIRQQVVRGEATRTAVCGGDFRLTVFSGSQVGQTVFDGDLRADGATEIARLRKVPTIVDETMNAVNKALPAARDKLPGDGTDTTAQYQVAAEYFAQAKPTTGTALMEFTMLTDGISTVPTGLTHHDLTTTEATRLARTVTPAQLSGVTVRIIGVGRTSGDEQLPAAYVDALKAFQTEVCRASRAASCLIVTDPESGGAK
jgi:hypothetical protein